MNSAIFSRTPQRTRGKRPGARPILSRVASAKGWAGGLIS